jgi:type IV secretion system protein VirB4
VGNFLVFGGMGSGKTVLVGFLIAQSMKFGGKRIIFDKDRGLEILVRAMNGVYEIIKPGMQTGFNPCQLNDTPPNRHFLTTLFKKLLTISGEPLTAQDSEIIEKAISGIYRLDKPARQFCHIASFFGAKKSGTLRARFDQWHSDGQHAWLFDNAQDTLNLNPDVLGFDLGHILADGHCRIPALTYLTYRVEQAIEGQRGLLFCDEGWAMLADDFFKDMINDWSRTPRKKDNIFGLATQVANDTVNAAISKSINESSACKIFFPNPAADRKVYREDFGLSEHEYQLIKTLPDDQHYFLLNHGRGTNKQSVVIRANLSGLEDDIAIISARENTLALLDQIRAEVGDDPKLWLPLFHARRKQGQI